ncbi:hypothetical protein [Pseudoclavibacter helvolus]|uniref:hypothetical protein n=1 Tax=Pseudoclavibacter helvolus TaxID=255205 RepID=UPI003C743C5C
MSDTPAQNTSSIERRRVLQGAAWAAPVLAVAAVAPGASASPCTQQYPGSVRFAATTGAGAQPANYVAGTGANATLNGSANITLVGAPAQVTPFTATITSTAITAGYTRNANNLALSTPTVAGGGAGTTPRLAIWQASPTGSTATTVGQTVTFNFPRPVRNLTFDLLGMTRSQATYSDAVFLTGPAFTVTGALGSQVSGAGTSASPWLTTAENANQGQTSAANSITGIRFAGPLTTFSLRYWSTIGSGQGQAVFLSNMTFTASCS